jgi:hypothetical protein
VRRGEHSGHIVGAARRAGEVEALAHLRLQEESGAAGSAPRVVGTLKRRGIVHDAIADEPQILLREEGAQLHVALAQLQQVDRVGNARRPHQNKAGRRDIGGSAGRGRHIDAGARRHILEVIDDRLHELRLERGLVDRARRVDDVDIARERHGATRPA